MAVDMFLKIEGCPGEAKDENSPSHADEIALFSFSWGATQQGSGAFGTGQGAGKVSMQDFHFVMRHCKASPVLMLACANGKHFPTAILTCRKAGENPVEYLVTTFTDVMISSYQTGASAGGDEYPTDQISFNYTKIDMKYTPQKNDGTPDNPVKAGYDVKANKKV